MSCNDEGRRREHSNSIPNFWEPEWEWKNHSPFSGTGMKKLCPIFGNGNMRPVFPGMVRNKMWTYLYLLFFFDLFQTIIFLLGGFSYTTFTFTVSCLGWMWFRMTSNLPSLQWKISGYPLNFKDLLRLYLCDYGMWWWWWGSESQNWRIFNP